MRDPDLSNFSLAKKWKRHLLDNESGRYISPVWKRNVAYKFALWRCILEWNDVIYSTTQLYKKNYTATYYNTSSQV